MNNKKLGLIVNPVAGIGGRVGLKGSDGDDIRYQALALGAEPSSGLRTELALQQLNPHKEELQIVTPPGEMGAGITSRMGFDTRLVGSIEPGNTTPEDTISAAVSMQEEDVKLLLFAGGDGTARDICNAVGQNLPVLGIPAGVKMQSAVFAKNPSSAGELAHKYLFASRPDTREAEVMDIDEELYRKGVLSSKLYGYLRIPNIRKYLQGIKTALPQGERSTLLDIASDLIANMHPEHLYILGPGTTTRAVTSLLGLEKTLLGVDVIKNRGIVLSDANEKGLLELLGSHPAKIIITPIGGQGFLLGRGNQQLSPAVIRRGGLSNICIISLPEKIYALGGQPLLIDTGDPDLDTDLSGFKQIITGFGERIVYPVSA